MNKLNAFVAAALVACSAQVFAEQFRVVGVMDGDTVKVLSSEYRQVKCRLASIDAPEKNQPFGQQSKQSLSDMIFNKNVEVTITDHDQYGRSVCRIVLNGIDINKMQMVRGFAWHYRAYSSDASYSQAESAARLQKLGLWADANPTPPWAFRRSEKSNY